jgi:SAM-dependent methyltransferase
VDFSPRLLGIAQAAGPGAFYRRDLAQAGCLDGLGQFDLVACLAALHHIPGQANRLRLLREMKAHLQPGGRLFLATWQFLSSERQRRKLRDWSLLGLRSEDVEEGDYLLSWERAGSGLRYVALLDATLIGRMAWQAGLVVHDQFYSDGREGNLSLYTILTAPAHPPQVDSPPPSATM